MAPLRIDPVAEARRHWEQRWGDDASRPMAAVTSIMRAQQVLLARLNDIVRPHGLTFPRYEALALLSFTRHGELPIGKLGERLQVHRTSASSIVAALADDGFVQRVPSDRDGRATLAVITDTGRRVARAATEDLNAAAFGIDALAPEEQEAVTALLRTLRLDAGDFVV
ncbi:MAG TPA: MarR family transcriptional regulator [Baekduia sp.]|jgi:DNA-binding MarR family transcriptional regulator